MATTLKEVRELAVALTELERETLADELWLSLQTSPANDAEQSEIDQAWDDEIGRRVQNLKDGKTLPMSGEEFFAGIRAEVDR